MRQDAPEEKLEILSVAYLTTHRDLVQAFRALGNRLHKGLGWHYLLDLAWAASHLTVRPGMLILDAGAGTGLMQWWLAEQGADVLSVDSASRVALPSRFRRTYRVKGWQPGHLSEQPGLRLRDFLPARSARHWPQYPRKLAQTLQALARKSTPDRRGTVHIYNQDLSQLAAVESGSVDAVVSISALEHNPPDKLRACASELMRVLKSGGRLVATLGAARDEDWYHEPSGGWCYTEQSLRGAFQLAPGCPSNYHRYDALFVALRACDELRDNLADFYFHSGDNGMPWGVWDPQYQPVGVIRIKQ